MPNPFDQSGNEQPQNNQFEDKTAEEFFEELVGEGKKYATPAEAVRALAHANHHISKIEGENADYRTKLEKASTVEDILNKMKTTTPSDDSNTGEDDPSKQTPSQDVDVESLVKNLFNEQQSKAQAEANRNKVIQAMQKQFGGKAGEMWDKAEAGLGVNLEDLCAQSPEAAMKLLGVTGEQQSGASADSFSSDKRPAPAGDVPPEGSKRWVDYQLAKGELNRQQAYKLKLQFSADPDKYNA